MVDDAHTQHPHAENVQVSERPSPARLMNEGLGLFERAPTLTAHAHGPFVIGHIRNHARGIYRSFISHVVVVTMSAPCCSKCTTKKVATSTTTSTTTEEPKIVKWDEEGGIRQEQKMRPPPPTAGMLNQEMAEAAAKQYKKREKNIQKACAKLDNPDQKQGCSCVIL